MVGVGTEEMMGDETLADGVVAVKADVVRVGVIVMGASTPTVAGIVVVGIL